MICLSSTQYHQPRIAFRLILILLIVLDQNYSTCHQQRHHGLETNEVIESEFGDISANDEDLSICQPHSICAFVQVNARGVSSRKYCRCSGQQICSLVWDPFDGHSITQGSDQYKFCNHAPELLPCSQHTSVAYSSTMAYAKDSSNLLTTAEHVHCRCPEMFTYETSDTSISDLNDRIEVMKVKYSCVPLKVCRAMEPCKAVSETPDNYFVHPKCMCPESMSCPTVTNTVLDTMSIGRGSVTMLGCKMK